MTTTLQNMKAWVDDAKENNRLGIALGHELVENPSAVTEWSIDSFQALIRHIVTQQVPCITIDDAYQLQSGPVTVELLRWRTREITRLHLATIQED